ncbi:MAG: magnesium transporter CorA family protein [Nanoarchaeota archaeon]|nr:magnesium transporter CorA family protein [Nanoarchaeota archaeon]
MITYFKRAIKDESLRKLNNFRVGCWINAVNPTKEEIKSLEEEFKLDKQNLIAGLDPNETPRIEIVDGKVYLFVKDIAPNKELETLLIVVTNEFILTLSREETNVVRKIVEGRIKIYTTQKLKSLIKILSQLNKSFEKATLEVVREVRSRRKNIRELSDRDVTALLEYEEILNNFIYYYYHMLILYNRMLKRIKFYEKDKEIIEDLVVEANEGFNLCKSSLKTISNIRDHYMILLSNKLNRVITILTLVTIFISIPAAISGIYGMNIALPLQHNPLAFWYILVLIIFIWIAFYWYLKKKMM